MFAKNPTESEKQEIASLYLESLRGEGKVRSDTRWQNLADQPTKALLGGIFAGKQLPVLKPGAQVGEYTIRGEIGCGGMSRVYLGTDRSGQEHAIKTPLIASPWASDQMKREFRIARSVESESIVQMRRLFIQNGVVCIAQRYEESQTIDRWVRAGLSTGELPCLMRINVLIRAMARCLLDLEHANVVHRDIKPDNILVDATGRLTLIDFGLATWFRALGSWTNPIIQPGTFRYLAPEAVLSPVVGHAADMYGFGRVLCYLLSGRLPCFDLPSESGWDRQRISHAIRQQLPNATPSELVDLCVGLHDFDQFQRPSALDVLNQFGGEEVLVSGAVRDEPAQSLQETEIIQRAFDDCVESRGRCLVYTKVGDEPKHRIRRAVDSLKGGDECILTLKCDVSADENIPLRAIDPLLSSLGEWLQNLDPELRSDWALAEGSQIARQAPVLAALLKRNDRQAVQASSLNGASELGLNDFADLMVSLSQERVLVLCIENLEHADDESWRTLQQLCEHLHSSSILIAASIDASDAEAMDNLNALGYAEVI